MISNNNIIFTSFFLFLLFTYNLSALIAFPNYVGNFLHYILLCFLINFLLYFSFFKSNYFFNIFLSLFILLGFGFKFTISLIFHTKVFSYDFSKPFNNELGTLRILTQKLLEKNNCISQNINLFIENLSYDYKYFCPNISDIIHNSSIYDKGLLVSIIGILSITIAMISFENLTKNQIANNKAPKIKTTKFYDKNRKVMIFLLFIFIIFVGYINFTFGIYQKGLKSNYDIFIVKPIIIWLLLFGFTALICNFLYSEHKKGTKGFKILVFFSFLEPFVSSTSMLSRGYIFNSSSIIFGLLKMCKNINIYYFISLIVFILSLFSISIYITQKNRIIKYQSEAQYYEKKINDYEGLDSKTPSNSENNTQSSVSKLNKSKNEKLNFILQVLIERWVGLEEVILTANSDKIGWDFLKESLNEKQKENKISLFDKEIYGEYSSIDRTKYNYTSIPGIIAFSFFSKNLIFVFLFLIFVTYFCLIIEMIVRKISYNNLFLSALIGQVLAFRLVHFGVYPIETYKILLAIILTLLISFSFSKLFLIKN